MRGGLNASSAELRRRSRSLLATLSAIGLVCLGAESFAATATSAPDLESINGGLPPLLELPSASIDDDDLRFQVFGFVDFSFFKAFIDDTNYLAAIVPEYSSFYVGNINTYFRTTFDRFTSLVEVRFLYTPHGSFDAFAASGNVDNEVTDSVDPSGTLRWGGVEIERAWLEIEFDPLLQLRVGQWLTPYGIWNVDHGSPTVIGVRRPFTIGQEQMPERQTGLQFKGALELDAHKLGYHFTLSNGRGKFDAITDLDSNKGLGGRVYYEFVSDVELSLGLSGYFGRYTSATTQVTADTGDLRFIRVIDVQYDEQVLSADLKVEWQGLLLQSEAVVNRRRYTAEGRPPLILEPGALIPDQVFWGGYVLLGYRTPLWNLMPYAMVERTLPATDTVRSSKSTVVYFGLNWRVHPRVTVKAEGVFIAFDGDNQLTEADTWALQSQIAWAF